jgi:hypothetical protein
MIPDPIDPRDRNVRTMRKEILRAVSAFPKVGRWDLPRFSTGVISG